MTAATDLDITDAAVLIALDRQWRVVPVAGKNPGAILGEGWQHKASDDPVVVFDLFDNPRVTGVGIVVPDDLVVIDVDPQNGGHVTMAALEAEHGPLPPTLTVATGGHELGRHHYFRRPHGDLVGKIPGGVDVKSTGQVLAPPSVHPDTGRRYRWVDPDVAIAECPPWLVELIVRRPGEIIAGQRRNGGRGERGNLPAGPAGRLLGLEEVEYAGPPILDAVNVLAWSEVWPKGWTMKSRRVVARHNLFPGEVVEWWLRPGSTSAYSAICGTDWCYVHSTAVEGVDGGPGLDEGAYTKAEVYAWALGMSGVGELASSLVRAVREVRRDG